MKHFILTSSICHINDRLMNLDAKNGWSIYSGIDKSDSAEFFKVNLEEDEYRANVQKNAVESIYQRGWKVDNKYLIDLVDQNGNGMIFLQTGQFSNPKPLLEVKYNQLYDLKSKDLFFDMKEFNQVRDDIVYRDTPNDIEKGKYDLTVNLHDKTKTESIETYQPMLYLKSNSLENVYLDLPDGTSYLLHTKDGSIVTVNGKPAFINGHIYPRSSGFDLNPLGKLAKKIIFAYNSFSKQVKDSIDRGDGPILVSLYGKKIEQPEELFFTPLPNNPVRFSPKILTGRSDETFYSQPPTPKTAISTPKTAISTPKTVRSPINRFDITSEPTISSRSRSLEPRSVKIVEQPRARSLSFNGRLSKPEVEILYDGTRCTGITKNNTQCKLSVGRYRLISGKTTCYKH